MAKSPGEQVRLLVTGGSGFIGTNVIEYYKSKGFDLLNIDIKTPQDKEHTSLWKNVDIRDLPGLRKAITDFDPTHVIHLAARADLDEKNDIAGYDANTTGVENMMEVLKECRNLKRVMFTSTMYVCIPGYDPVDYLDYAPHTVYGESKVQTEKIVAANANTPYEWVMIRPTSIWGPWFRVPYNEFFHHVNNRTFFNVIGKTATKTYGFVLNSVHQVDTLLFAAKEIVNKKTFYIGDHPGLNVNEWGQEIARQLGIKLLPMPLFVLRLGGLFGDFLGVFKIRFPLTSFRMRNMTSDSVISLLKDTKVVVPDQPYDVAAGVKITLDWLKKHDPAFQK